MKAWILAVALLTATLIHSKTYAQETAAEKWYACKKSADCVKVDAGCGRKEAIHKKFKAEQARFIKKSSAKASCLEPTPEEIETDTKSMATCVDKKCDLRG